MDALALSKTFSKVKRNRLSVDEDERQIDDEIKQRRDAYSLLGDIEARIENVAKAELEIGREKLQKIFDAFGDDEVGEDEITEFIARVKKFYEAANKAQVNVKEISLDGIKKVSTLEKAIADISAVLDETDPLNVIMAFSGDPVTVIKPFIDIIDAVETEMTKAKNQISSRMAELGFDSENDNNQNKYAEEMKCIKSNRDSVERLVNI